MAGQTTITVQSDSQGTQVPTLPLVGQDTSANSLPVVLDSSVETNVGTSGTRAVTFQGALGGVPTPTTRPPVTYSAAAGYPKAVGTGWTFAVTTTTATKALRLAPVVSASAYDIEWTVVAAGATAPTDTYGEPIQGGEDFAAGIPLGDVYLRSATSQVAIVKTGI